MDTLRAQAGQPFEALAVGAPTGLQLAVEVYDPATGLAATYTAAPVTEPRPGTYRAVLTIADPGDYLIRWTAPGLPDAEEEVAVYTVSPVVTVGPRPALVDLGAIMRARTRSMTSGAELGTFTDETSPTGDEADLAIDRAVDLVSARLGDVPSHLEGMARSIIALRAAMLVETSYVPEEADPGSTSAYASYREQYVDALADYDSAIQNAKGQGRDPHVASVRMSTLLNP